MMIMSIFRFLLTFSFIFILCVFANDDGTCSIDPKSSETDSSCSDSATIKVSKSWNKYLTDYQRAQDDFKTKTCQTEKSSKLHCDYDRVIQQELGQYDKIT